MENIDTTGEFTFTLADDAVGSASITVEVSDDGGTERGGVDTTTQTFEIEVTLVNDAPIFSLSGPLADLYYDLTADGQSATTPDFPSGTTVMHELGHLLGREHACDNSDSLLAELLPTSTRRLPDWGFDHLTDDLFETETLDLLAENLLR